MAKRLYRSQKNKIIGGVAGGLADYLNLDPILIRVIFVLALFLNGAGFLLYIILWIVVPQESVVSKKQNDFGETDNSETDFVETDNFQKSTNHSSNGTGRVVTGLILIGVGIVFLINRFFPHFDFGDILPFFIIVLGIALIFNSINKRSNDYEN